MSSVGALTVNGSADFSPASGGPVTLTVPSLTVSGGTITGSDSFIVSGPLNWTHGVLSGSFSVTADGSAVVNGTNGDVLDGATLNLEDGGFLGGGMQLDNGAVVNNYGSLDVPSGVYVTGSGTFNNYGSLALQENSAQLASGSYNEIGGGGIFNNTGSVEVQGGGTIFGAGTSSGSFLGDAGTTLDFAAQSFTATSSISGDSVIFEGNDTVAGTYSAQTATTVNGPATFTGPVSSLGALTVNGSADFSPASGGPVTLTLPSLTISGGTITGSDSFIVSGPLNWTHGVLSGSFSVTADGSADVNGTNGDVLDGATLNLEDGGLIGGGVLIGGGGILNSYGSVDSPAGVVIDNYANFSNSTPGTFNNYGSLVVTLNSTELANGGYNLLGGGVIFNNPGSVEVQSGDAVIGSGSSSGSFVGDAGTTLDFAAQSFTATSSISGDSVIFEGNDTVAGTYSAQTATTINGPATFTGSVSSLGALTVNGSADFSPASGVPATLTLSSLSLGGTLSGADSFVVSGAFNWTGGTLSGQGSSLTADGGGVIGSGVTLNGRTLVIPASITSSENPSFFGQTVTFTATTFGTLTLPGSMVFEDTSTGVNLGTVPLSGGSAFVTTSSLVAGAHTITAEAQYSGGTTSGGTYTFPSSTGSLTQTVAPATTSTAVSSSLNPSIYGQNVTFTATVSNTTAGSSFTPTGSVQFIIDGSDYGSAVALVNGSASISDNALSVRGSPHSIVADYLNSDGNFQDSNGSLTQVVNKATPIFSLAAPPTIIDGTSNTQITGYIAAGSLIPSGSVTVTVNGISPSATINPTNGYFAVTVPTASLGTGSYTIGYSYAGDSNFTSASATANMDVTNGVLVLSNQSHAKNAGSTIPIQIELVSASGQDLSSAGTTVTALGIAATTDTTDTTGSIDPSLVGALQPVQAAGNSNPNNVFSEQGGSKAYYMYNLQTPTGLTAGTYRLYFQVQGDPLLHWVTFSIS